MSTPTQEKVVQRELFSVDRIARKSDFVRPNTTIAASGFAGRFFMRISAHDHKTDGISASFALHPDSVGSQKSHVVRHGSGIVAVRTSGCPFFMVNGQPKLFQFQEVQMAIRNLTPEEAILHLYRLSNSLDSLSYLPAEQAADGVTCTLSLLSNAVRSCAETLDNRLKNTVADQREERS
jgi:hypothetical protein